MKMMNNEMNYSSTSEEDSFGINLIEEENYGLLKMAEANGLSTNEMIRKILREKLKKEGFLEEE
tara:strand:- start:762 stop:953 length:192 start_codon:yes stop_codon:yes gene_type:complete